MDIRIEFLRNRRSAELDRAALGSFNKRMRVGQEFVEEYRQRKQIRTFVDIAEDLFRRHISECFVSIARYLETQQSCDAEVQNANFAGLTNEDVAGPNVAMNDVFL